MSKYTQIDVHLVPVFGPEGLARPFPRLAAFLKQWGRTQLLENPPSLYHLVEHLRRLANDPEVPDAAKKAAVQALPALEAVRDQARENFLALRLKDLDQDLYRLEDLFQDLETDLSW